MTTVTYAASAAYQPWGLLVCLIALVISAGPIFSWLRQQDGERVTRIGLGLALLGLGAAGYARAATIYVTDVTWGCWFGFICW